MIRGVHIARYRGIRELAADGFGRVNLVVGRNNCGKTAFLEAVQLADDAEDAAYYLLRGQESRFGRRAKKHDFDRFWQSVFFDLDAKAGLSVSVSYHDSTSKTFCLRRAEPSEEIIIPDNSSQVFHDSDDYESLVAPSAWSLDLQLVTRTQEKVQRRIVSTPTGVAFPPFATTRGSAWIGSGVGRGEPDVRHVSVLKQRGQDTILVDLLREVDARLSGIEILAPGGDMAELFVRLNNGTPMLSAMLMGEGFQRCLELGAAAAARDWPTLFVDEIENGMHYLALEPLWRWIATIASRRNLQVFATTHSEECIHAACRAFQGLDDDGLRVIRLDRLEKETRATIYDRALIEVAERTGTEIRG